MSDKEFIKEIIKRIDRHGAINDVWITEGNEIYTCEESTHLAILRTLGSLGLEECIRSNSELVDDLMYYSIYFA